MNMKFSLGMLLLFCAGPGYAFTSQFACDRVVFSGLTFKKEKQVKVCLNDTGVVYTFGSVDPVPPELDIQVPSKETHWYKYNVTVWDTTLPPGKDVRTKGEGFSVRNGHYLYQMSVGVNGSQHYETIKVYRDGKRLTKIKLRHETIFTNIDRYLEDDFDIQRIHKDIWMD